MSGILAAGAVNYWSGEEGKQFEREFAQFHDRRHGVAVANGTLALELAFRSMGIGPGDEVVVTPRTFIASASAVVACGATPIFADVDLDSGNLSPDDVARRITPNTRAMVAVHLGGWPCDMDALCDIAEKNEMVVVEDCAQAHGATWKGSLVGSFGAAAAFSFCTDKIISTGGEGGMLLLDSEEAWKRAWAFKDHGKSWDAVYRQEHPAGFRWLAESFGSNWRMPEIQSAIGRIQLRNLPESVETRRANAQVLLDGLEGLPGLRIPRPPVAAGHAWYKFHGFVQLERLREGWSRDRIVQALIDLGVPCAHGACSEIYLERAFLDAGLAPKAPLANARTLGETSFMLPVDPTLSVNDMEQVVHAFERVMSAAGK